MYPSTVKKKKKTDFHSGLKKKHPVFCLEETHIKGLTDIHKDKLMTKKHMKGYKEYQVNTEN
jgi:hypothetical protein